MGQQKIPYTKTNQFSDLICDFLDQKEVLRPFYHRFPELAAFKSQIQDKSQNFSLEQRVVLTQQLEEQNKTLNLSAKSQANIQALKQKTTFTVTTGHQLNLFTGPLYFLYKIIDVINLCQELAIHYPEYNFVPIYWMASEDHDFEEINHFRFFDKSFAWDTDHGGPVGRLSTENLSDLSEALKNEWSGHVHGDQLLDWFQAAYAHESLAQATRVLANNLFGEEGLVVVDGDDPVLKKAFLPVALKELNQQACAHSINASTAALTQLGYHKQVHPREINLFYCEDTARGRVIADGQGFVIEGSLKRFTAEELQHDLEAHPERISPNALLRPVYQELILPNLAYVGGAGELAYWLQLKKCFDDLSLVFPMLVLRTSVLLVPEKAQKKLEKINVSVANLFASAHDLSSFLIEKITEIPIDFSPQRKMLQEQFSELYALAAQTDASFVGAVSAQEQKQINGLNHLEKRLMKAQKRKHKDQLERLMALRAELFPGGHLQERTQNMSQWYYVYGTDIVTLLKSEIKPLEFQFHILTI